MTTQEEIQQKENEIKILKAKLEKETPPTPPTHEINKHGSLIVKGNFDGHQDNQMVKFKGYQYNVSAKFNGSQYNQSAKFNGNQYNQSAKFNGKMIFDDETKWEKGIFKRDENGDLVEYKLVKA